jgi:hypothetical protein
LFLFFKKKYFLTYGRKLSRPGARLIGRGAAGADPDPERGAVAAGTRSSFSKRPK